MRKRVVSLVRQLVPLWLIGIAVAPRTSGKRRAGAAVALISFWVAIYARYRARGRRQTAREYELLRTANWEAFTRHYNEQVPTIEEEFDLWGEYHQHRHEMRYDLVAGQVRGHLRPGGSALDVGCGSALVADRILDIPACYVGLDFPAHHMTYVAKRFVEIDSRLDVGFVRGDGEGLPFSDDSFDVVVMSEVIEHLLRPELAVWEIARVLRPGGVFVMTTNNASEVPLRSPLSHILAWAEKALGVHRPELISLRPWIWPSPVDQELLPPGSPKVYLPHTHHIFGQTRELFASAGLDTIHFSTFEFPPPQSASARWLDDRGELGRRVVDVIERVAQATPVVRRLGCHMLVVSRKARQPVATRPPEGVWPGPFSSDAPVSGSAPV